eukprot:1247301-Ditylum_brightwellii.AAC.1
MPADTLPLQKLVWGRRERSGSATSGFGGGSPLTWPHLWSRLPSRAPRVAACAAWMPGMNLR